MRVIVRSKDANFRMPVPIGLASVVVKLIPKAVFDKMGEDVPKPYDSLVSKDIICMINWGKVDDGGFGRCGEGNYIS